MTGPFIRNHEYNFIKKQLGILQNAYRTVSDPKITESVRYSAESKIIELLPHAADDQKDQFAEISRLKTAEDFQTYLRSLEPYLVKFPQVTEKQIRKLFPKNKKLKIPDLLSVDYRYVTYMGWNDIATNKMFMVYHLDGQVVGIEGRCTPANKQSTCFVCNKHAEVALFSAVTKSKPAGASSDHYKAVGNYLCLDSGKCNQNITDVASLERFIREVLG